MAKKEWSKISDAPYSTEIPRDNRDKLPKLEYYSESDSESEEVIFITNKVEQPEFQPAHDESTISLQAPSPDIQVADNDDKVLVD